ncbi:MAG TPA: hypothetical protein DHU75_03435 [Rikenellaceae bacterium]|nr:hypothetical protein [Rikenellaceae bacterium]
MYLIILFFYFFFNFTDTSSVKIEELNSVHYYDTASKTNKTLFTIRVYNTGITPILVWFNQKEKFSKRENMEMRRLLKYYNTADSLKIKKVFPKSKFDFILVIESNKLVIKEPSIEWLIQRIHYIEADNQKLNFIQSYPYNDIVTIINK